MPRHPLHWQPGSSLAAGPGCTDSGTGDTGDTGDTATNLFQVAFDMVIEGKPYQDRCIGSFIKITLDPTGSPAVDGIISCDWQDELGAAFGIYTMGGLIDGEASGSDVGGDVGGDWSLGPIAEPWAGSFDAQGNLSGAFSGKGKLNYGGTDVTYSYDGSLEVDAGWPPQSAPPKRPSSARRVSRAPCPRSLPSSSSPSTMTVAPRKKKPRPPSTP
ncbi:MAG: hypothetical protein GXP62_04620 [Oligoflexia bacterium]|nr:hypothetical protein [Oligoflexia bacterium]